VLRNDITQNYGMHIIEMLSVLIKDLGFFVRGCPKKEGKKEPYK